MWMQALGAAGLAVLGEKFPQGWRNFEAANPRGYFECVFTEGIHSRTNTARLTAEQTQKTAVKVFLRGLPLSQLAFLDSVLVTVRHPSAYAASLQRATTIFGKDPSPWPHEPYLKWWLEHWMVLEDVLLRGYRCRFVSYEATIEHPERVVPEVLAWMRVSCDQAAAIASVEASLCTRSAEPAAELPSAWVPAFDDLYGRILRGAPLDGTFLSRWRSFHLDLTELARSHDGLILDRWARPA
jgi:hypothetical protein